MGYYDNKLRKKWIEKLKKREHKLWEKKRKEIENGKGSKAKRGRTTVTRKWLWDIITISLGKKWIEKLKESANSEKREVPWKSKDFKATDSDFNSDQSDETIPQDD